MAFWCQQGAYLPAQHLAGASPAKVWAFSRENIKERSFYMHSAFDLQQRRNTEAISRFKLTCSLVQLRLSLLRNMIAGGRMICWDHRHA